jgi:hypothetical protein
MANSISTDTTLLATGLITEYQKNSLTPDDWSNETETEGPWYRWHRQAWSEMLLHYASLPDPIEESDISNTVILRPIAHYYVLYLAYWTAGKMDWAEKYFERYKELISEIRPPLSGGGEADTSGRSVLMCRG